MQLDCPDFRICTLAIKEKPGMLLSSLSENLFFLNEELLETVGSTHIMGAIDKMQTVSNWQVANKDFLYWLEKRLWRLEHNNSKRALLLL